MNNPIFQFSVPFMKIEQDESNNLSRIIIDKEGIFPFFAPKEFSLMVNDRLLGNAWEFSVDSINKEGFNICFINHHPKPMNFIKDGNSLDFYASFPNDLLYKFYIECIQNCGYMVVLFDGGLIQDIYCTVPYYHEDPNVMYGASDIFMYSMYDKFFAPNIFQNYILNN